MRVLHAFKDYFPPTPGGIEYHIHDVVHSLDGIDFAVLTSSRKREQVVDDDRGVRVIRAAEYFRPVSTPFTPSWPRLLRKSGADLFHFHVPNPFGELAFLASRAKTPMVVTYHSDIVGRKLLLPFFVPFQRMFLNRAKRIIVSSPRLAENSPTLKRFRDRISVIPFGVDPDYWERKPVMTDSLRGRYPGFLVVFVGRLVYYKGVDVLIRAMRSVEGTALVVGGGPKLHEWRELSRTIKTRPNVHFLGEVPDEERSLYYHAADVVVLPATSKAETFGISMLEAMATGTPVISTEVGTGTSWVNLDRKTGLVVEPNSPSALSGAIKAMMQDERKRSAMADAARRRVLENFTKEQMLQGIADVYSRAL